MYFDGVWIISNFSKYVSGVSYSVVSEIVGEIVGRAGDRVLRMDGDRIRAANAAIETQI